MKAVKRIAVSELKIMSDKMFGSIVKADVDIAKGIVLIDMEMHADGEAYLLEHGSKQRDLWGINLHPSRYGTDDFIEFDSMINIRPSQGNPSNNVLDELVRTAIVRLVNGLVYE